MNLNQVNKRLKEKTGVFFQGENWKNSLVFLFFLALAFLFWLLHYYQQSFEVGMSVPIHYTQAPPDIVLSNSAPQTLNLKIKDKGTILLNYLFHEGNIDVSLKGIQLNQDSYTLSHSDLNNLIREYLPNTVQLLSFYPETITIGYSPLEKKELPITLEGNIKTSAGYIFTGSEINPSTVTVYGDHQTLDTLQEIKTVPIEKSGLRKNLSLSLDLQIPEGTRLSTKEVDLTIDIKAYTEKTIELPIISRNLPKDRNLRYFPSSVEVICQVALDDYSRLTKTELEVSVNYIDLIENRDMNIPLTLSKKPQWLIDYRIVPEKVEYLIEQKQ